MTEGNDTMHLWAAIPMAKRVLAVESIPWRELTGLPGARGYEFKPLVGDEGYTEAYSCELVRLDPTDHSVPHTEPWNHALYFLKGRGAIAIGGNTAAIAPGTLCKIKAGEVHALTNDGPGEMLILAIYDPPRRRLL